MPKIDESNASKATDTLTRRAAAVLLDLGAIGLPTAIFSILSTERFQIVEFSDGRARFAIEDQVRINEIDAGLNRAMQIGDTVFTLSGIGLLLTVLVLTTLTALVFFVVPGLRMGQTPGRSILGLPVRSDDTANIEVLSVSVTDTEIEDEADGPECADLADDADGLPVEQFSEIAPPQTARDQVQSEPAVVNQPDARSADDGFEVGRLPATDGITIVPSDRLRQELEAKIKHGSPPIQVTLGTDDDYADWGELGDLNLTDRAENSGGRENQFETLTLPESSLSETPLTATNSRSGGSEAPANAGCLTATVERRQQIEDRITPEPTPVITPEWSPEWQAWVYLDEATRRWFRHDQSANRWIPIN